MYQNFEQKLVEICKNDFSDFNELLSMMESDLIVTEEEGNIYFSPASLCPRVSAPLRPCVAASLHLSLLP